MRRSFSVKLRTAISLLTVGLTSVSVFYVYFNTRALILKQINDRLKDMAHIGTFLIDEELRESLVDLKARIDRDSQVTAADIAKIPPGGFLNSLSPEDIETYHQTPEFQRLTQVLRVINRASRDRIEPLQDNYPQEFLDYPSAVLPYLAITTPESPDRSTIKFIASFAPEPEGEDWPGNPIGNLYRPTSPIFADAFEGESQVSRSFYSDSFYTSTTAAVPIKDSTGSTIAVLGLDLPIASEYNALVRLRFICIVIIALSFVLSILLAAAISRGMSQPLQLLAAGVQQVRERDYSGTISLNTGDELEDLANVFNRMVQDIRTYATTLESKNRQLAHYSRTLEAEVTARTMELRTANEQLQLLATSDGLTHLANRYFFDRGMDEAWQEASHRKTPITLILSDVDYFKRYNDTYGHQAGDDCLRLVAGLIQEAVPEGLGVVARYGGEEFAILLPSAGPKEGLRIAKGIQKSISQAKIRHETSLVGPFLSISQGVGTVIPVRSDTPTTLIEMADRALYRAKAEGRDGIVAVQNYEVV
ncbi:GGDEF domain-containing protein [Synechococcus sp. PCC 7336]|uniref:sensor domain-containing diguanylate cyclase n=1 Tax=Synechococcus sp. PCC 7336 TaxID=195250 RepID=UPI000687B9BC|nr:GGDEF domain-containing protein [Synechococcus sp. PCC 7336]